MRVLLVLEGVLLSSRGRKRLHISAVYTLIFAFLFTSVDYLLTGGPEWDLTAPQSAPIVHAELISATSLPMEAAAPPLQRAQASVSETEDYSDAGDLLGEAPAPHRIAAAPAPELTLVAAIEPAPAAFVPVSATPAPARPAKHKPTAPATQS